MSYQVLARKWRPKCFAELVGQEHVVRALTNALANNRLHHAFLFTGTRGVGKTTLSRILAKSLNCETGVTAEPCGHCSACREIDEGRFVDLIEVDAASRTKVEDTRELLDNVQYAPTRGRYKVYLIDEVHMLSTHSFNALLKTLEEPPPHVKFLLATTDPQKLPVTILSRCLQFALKRLPTALISEHLAQIIEAEGIPGEPAALAAIARAGDGSMRDALSLLDQAIAYGGGRVDAADAASMLGAIDRQHVIHLASALAQGAADTLLEAIATLDREAPDYDAVLADLLSLLQRVAQQQVLPGSACDDWFDLTTLQALARAFTAEDVQLCYQIGLHGRRDLPLAPEPRGGFEMTLLRMLCFRPASLTDTRHDPIAAAGTPSTRSDAATPPGRQEAAATGVAESMRGEPVTAPEASPRPSARAELDALLGRRASGAQKSPAPRPAPVPPVEPQQVHSEVASLASQQPAELPRPAAPKAPAPVITVAEDAEPASVEPADDALAAGTATTTVAAEVTLPDWGLLCARLNVRGRPQQLALHAVLEAIDAGQVRLALDPAHASLLGGGVEEKLAAALGEALQRPVHLVVRMGASGMDTPARVVAAQVEQQRHAAVEAFQQNQAVRTLIDTFDARVRVESIVPRT
ncbi:DNA polymerase III subunit gamma/tau [Plasticicumulans acidivorans]|uniref:DNA polymerase III subunit gamma/tau n=1 Tax=Plasticicumulans acidivorans TaxID=886464 RepID=A0A317MRR6_9GAMM|nr:DNA polymerase III subunit gamma/tau [Plasticicumulans acidivorans]PWV59258.1 DNA polymerase III gamma subunit /DNA polymerase III tau subunit [Plasticicumulans acidivorans]